ncbi:helicase-associated domain-containing protein [Streptomyces albulus]|nr:helicase-associated domain-containing protein [Streptomyces noursei]
MTWRFTPAPVRRALDSGHTVDTLRTALAAASAAGSLPQPLDYLLQDTARSHGRMRVVPTGCCIRSDDEALLAELAAHHALRELALRALAPTVLVSGRPPAATLDALRAAGYAPALESDTGAATVERLPSHRTAAPAPPAPRRPRSPSPGASWGTRRNPRRAPHTAAVDPLPCRRGGAWPPRPGTVTRTDLHGEVEDRVSGHIAPTVRVVPEALDAVAVRLAVDPDP